MNRERHTYHKENYTTEDIPIDMKNKMPEVITVSLLPPMPENMSPLPTLSSMTSIMPEDIMMPSADM